MTRWSGERPPAWRCVALHGFLGCGEDWRASGLEGAWCPDLPGHGETPLGEVPSMEAWADALAAQIDRPVDIVGYSMGGRLALALARRHPHRVRRLVLVSASAGLEGSDARAERARADVARAAELRALADDPGRWASWLRAWLSQPLFAPLGDMDEAVARRARRDPRAMADIVEGLSPGRAPWQGAWLREWAGETLWVAGSEDARYARAAEEYAGQMRRAEARILAGEGHALLDGAPVALAGVVAPFLGQR